jgi:hypothetical protein
LRQLQEAYDQIPLVASAPIHPFSSSAGHICSGFSYALDSHFTVGKGGATSISRNNFGTSAFGPPVALARIYQYSSASLTPAGGTTTTVAKSSTTGSVQTALVDWLKPSIGDNSFVTSTSCSGSTYSSVQLSAGDGQCTGAAAFASLSKTYSTCANVP